jgi:L,D-peptidoglycan transpeptidase YkuD (ErfK/YbiS/YcfS/YnhG family)
VVAAALAGCGANAGAAVHGEAAPAGRPPPAPAAAARAAAPALLVDHLRGVHDARQVVSVVASGYGSTYATVRAFAKTSHGWRQTFGPWTARIGRNGFAPRGDKREGDGRTPTGSFHLQFMFGVDPNPGVHFRYRQSQSTSKWDDDSASANYNRWVDTRSGYPGRNPESMRVLPVYRYGVVVAYNTARTPGRGSAIFFHVTDGQSTAGCIAVSRSRVVRLLRWLRPVRKPRMIMGTKAAVTS